MKRLTPYLSVVLSALLLYAVPLLAETPVDVTGAAPSIAALEQLPSPPPPPAQSIPTVNSGASPAQPGTPARATLPGSSTAQPQPPSVSITNTGASGYKSHSGKTKWIIAAVVAGGAAGAMMAMKGGKGGTTAAAPTALSIGTPSISIGRP